MDCPARERRTSRRMILDPGDHRDGVDGGWRMLPAHATTPGKNGRIAFAMDKGSGAEIYSIKRDGTGLRKLTSASGEALYPDWSPKGRTILFADDVNEGTASNLAIMHSDGSHFRDLTTSGFREHPDFIPGSRHIVYACDCSIRGCS